MKTNQAFNRLLYLPLPKPSDKSNKLTWQSIAKLVSSGCLLGFCLLFANAGFAQITSENFTLYDTRNGLPHEHVTSIARDNDGFIWVGTFNGLARYNGHEFQNYELRVEGNKHSFENVIGALYCDDDALWAGSSAGIVACLSGSNKWNTISLPLQQNGLPYSVTCLTSNQKSVFIGCFDGSVIILNKQSEEISIQKIDNLPIKQISSRISDLVILTEEATRFFELDKSNDSLVELRSELKDGAVTYHNGSFVFGKKEGFEIFQPKTAKTYSLALPNYENGPSRIMPFKTGFIHVLNNRVTLLDTLGHVQDGFDIGSQEVFSTSYTANCALESKNDVVWLGTSSGLLKLIKTQYEFKKYGTNAEESSMPYTYVRGMYADDRVVFIGTKQGEVMQLRIDSPYEKRIFKTLPIEGLGNSNFATVNTLLKLRNGQLLAAGLEGIWLLKNDSFVVYPPFQTYGTKQVPHVWSLVEDSLERIWIGTLGNGLLLLDPKKESLERIGVKNGLSSETVWTLMKDRAGTIWVGTQDGLDSASYSKSHLSFTPLSTMLKDSLDGKQVWHVVEDKAYNLWIGTTDNGLAYFDRQKRLITNFHAHDGLKSEAIAGLSFNESKTQLWVSTINGLHALDLASMRFSEWGVDDGLLSNEFNFKSIALAQNDELFLGSKSGLVSFNTEQVKAVGGLHPLRITSWQTNGVWQPYVSPINLSKQQRNLSLRFCLLEYSVPSKHWYRYKLDGFDEDWQYANALYRTATYTNIPPGDYTFYIEASLGKTWKTAGENQLSVVVTPKLLEVWWFQVLMALTVLVLMTGIIFLGFWRYNEKNRVRTRVAELERRMLTAQMNPHFLFNSMNTIQHFILTHDTESANAYLDRFSRLIRMFLEASSRKLISLENELNLLKTYTELEEMRFEDRFTSTFSVDSDLNLHEIELPSSLVQPFVENAILHGLAPKTENGELHIAFEKTNDALQITVEDNGVGRKPSKEKDAMPAHKSSGMKLVNELTSSYENLAGFPKIDIGVVDKKDKTGNPLGTKVILTIHLI